MRLGPAAVIEYMRACPSKKYSLLNLESIWYDLGWCNVDLDVEVVFTIIKLR